MINKKIENLIDNSATCMAFKDNNFITRYANKHMLVFYKGTKIKTQEELVGQNVNSYSALNRNVYSNFIKENTDEDKEAFFNEKRMEKKHIPLLLSNNELRIYNRVKEPVIDNKKIIGIMINISFVTLSLYETYQKYKEFYPNDKNGRRTLINFLNISHIWDGRIPSDQELCVFIWKYERHHIKNTLFPNFSSKKQIIYNYSSKLNESIYKYGEDKLYSNIHKKLHFTNG